MEEQPLWCGSDFHFMVQGVFIRRGIMTIHWKTTGGITIRWMTVYGIQQFVGQLTGFVNDLSEMDIKSNKSKGTITTKLSIYHQ